LAALQRQPWGRPENPPVQTAKPQLQGR
jgi:hypothetical protein